MTAIARRLRRRSPPRTERHKTAIENGAAPHGARGCHSSPRSGNSAPVRFTSRRRCSIGDAVNKPDGAIKGSAPGVGMPAHARMSASGTGLCISCCALLLADDWPDYAPNRIEDKRLRSGIVLKINHRD